MVDKLFAPWTQEQVDAINESNPRCDLCGGEQYATTEFLVCTVLGCSYTQTWVPRRYVYGERGGR